VVVRDTGGDRAPVTAAEAAVRDDDCDALFAEPTSGRDEIRRS
jgi:hypothetical protein